MKIIKDRQGKEIEVVTKRARTAPKKPQTRKPSAAFQRLGEQRDLFNKSEQDARPKTDQ